MKCSGVYVGGGGGAGALVVACSQGRGDTAGGAVVVVPHNLKWGQRRVGSQVLAWTAGAKATVLWAVLHWLGFGEEPCDTLW